MPQMRNLAETDPRTGCLTRRTLMERPEQEMDRAALYATMLTGMQGPRYGGEEFVVMLPETTSAESRNFAERLLRHVATHDFGEAGQLVRVTISIGIASYPDESVTDGDSLLRLADSHLYRAKSDGRNRIRD